MQGRNIASIRSPYAAASAWLVLVTTADLALDGQLRSTIFYAIPVALVAWGSVIGGFVFAAISSICAWIGGSIPSPNFHGELWIEGLWAFSKLSAIALGANWVHAKIDQTRKEN